jgi:alpha-L-fucosidase
MIHRSFFFAGCLALFLTANAQNKDSKTVSSEHSMINMATQKVTTHTFHPDAQWFPDAGLGLFIHWGLASVKNLDI